MCSLSFWKAEAWCASSVHLYSQRDSLLLPLLLLARHRKGSAVGMAYTNLYSFCTPLNKSIFNISDGEHDMVSLPQACRTGLGPDLSTHDSPTHWKKEVSPSTLKRGMVTPAFSGALLAENKLPSTLLFCIVFSLPGKERIMFNVPYYYCQHLGFLEQTAVAGYLEARILLLCNWQKSCTPPIASTRWLLRTRHQAW